MNATRHVRSVRVVRNPPHIVIAPALQFRIIAFCKRCLVLIGRASGRNVVYSYFRNNLPAVQPSAVSHHLAESRHIAKVQVKAAACKRDSRRVNLVVAVVMRTKRLPNHLGHHISKPLPCYARANPGKKLCVHGSVAESVSVF